MGKNVYIRVSGFGIRDSGQDSESLPGSGLRISGFRVDLGVVLALRLQGHLAQKKQHPPRTLQWDYA